MSKVKEIDVVEGEHKGYLVLEVGSDIIFIELEEDDEEDDDR